jgi:hypothetical protein
MSSAPAGPQAPAEYQAEELRKALRQARINLALIALMLLAFVAAVCYAVWWAEHRLQQKEEQTLAVVRERLARDMRPIGEELGDLAAEVGPPVAVAFYERLKADVPAYVHTVDEQSKELTEHVEAAVRRDVRAQYQGARDRYRDILQEEFPEVTDPAQLDAMMARFEVVFNRLIQRYYVDQFRDLLSAAIRHWNAIPPAAPPRPGEKSLADQLAADVSEWARLKVVERGAPALAPKEDRR